MTLKVRVIPTLLWKSAGLVKGVSFDSWRRVGPIVPAVRVYTARDVDELAVMDITATIEGRSPDLDLIAEVAAHATIPLAYGGGISCADQVAQILEAGADKVIINSSLYANLSLAERCAEKFGTQCVVAGIDFRRNEGVLQCYKDSGTTPVNIGALDWAQSVVSAGAGEVLLTSVDLDGAMSGYDIEAIGEVCSVVDAPVIASGGAGKTSDFVDAVLLGGASAVAAASVFHFTELTPFEVKVHMSERGIPVRHPPSE